MRRRCTIRWWRIFTSSNRLLQVDHQYQDVREDCSCTRSSSTKETISRAEGDVVDGAEGDVVDDVDLCEIKGVGTYRLSPECDKSTKSTTSPCHTGGTVITSRPPWQLELLDALLFWLSDRQWHDLFFARGAANYLFPGDRLFFWAEGMGYQKLEVAPSGDSPGGEEVTR